MGYQNKDRIRFGYEEISRILGITPDSAKVSANRYVKQGLLVRIKRNVYVLKEKWRTLEKEERLMLANLAQVPSYISLMTALDYYEATTQVQRDFIESVAVKRTKEIEIEKVTFNYVRINEKLYFDFTKKKGFFIATPEKAFLDALYLMSLRRYSFDLSSVDSGKFDAGRIRWLAGKFPLRTQKALGDLERNGRLKAA